MPHGARGGHIPNEWGTIPLNHPAERLDGNAEHRGDVREQPQGLARSEQGGIIGGALLVRPDALVVSSGHVGHVHIIARRDHGRGACVLGPRLHVDPSVVRPGMAFLRFMSDCGPSIMVEGTAEILHRPPVKLAEPGEALERMGPLEGQLVEPVLGHELRDVHDRHARPLDWRWWDDGVQASEQVMKLSLADASHASVLAKLGERPTVEVAQDDVPFSRQHVVEPEAEEQLVQTDALLVGGYEDAGLAREGRGGLDGHSFSVRGRRGGRGGRRLRKDGLGRRTVRKVEIGRLLGLQRSEIGGLVGGAREVVHLDRLGPTKRSQPNKRPTLKLGELLHGGRHHEREQIPHKLRDEVLDRLAQGHGDRDPTRPCRGREPRVHRGRQRARHRRARARPASGAGQLRHVVPRLAAPSLAAVRVAHASPEGMDTSSTPAVCVEVTTLVAQLNLLKVQLETVSDAMDEIFGAVQAGRGDIDALMIRLQGQMALWEATRRRAVAVSRVVLFVYDGTDSLCEGIDVPLTS